MEATIFPPTTPPSAPPPLCWTLQNIEQILLLKWEQVGMGTEKIICGPGMKREYAR